MNSSQTIFLMAVACLVFIGLLIFVKPIKMILRILIQGIIGCAGIFAANLIMAAFGAAVGVNLMTAFIVGVLGLPGFVLLYAAQFIL